MDKKDIKNILDGVDFSEDEDIDFDGTVSMSTLKPLGQGGQCIKSTDKEYEKDALEYAAVSTEAKSVEVAEQLPEYKSDTLINTADKNTQTSSTAMKADLSKIPVIDLGIDHKNDTDLMFVHPIGDSLSVYKTVREDTAERDSESKVETISSSHKWRDAHEAFKARNKKILEAVDEALEKDDLFDIK